MTLSCLLPLPVGLLSLFPHSPSSILDSISLFPLSVMGSGWSEVLLTFLSTISMNPPNRVYLSPEPLASFSPYNHPDLMRSSITPHESPALMAEIGAVPVGEPMMRAKDTTTFRVAGFGAEAGEDWARVVSSQG
ncbi:hypothetical protein JAAARDRAFT_50303 [Jaapia argillacea MUCL 33604]|uniref:Uncharacterized protein n=1 Tax=Jaapia argillacea MUCL 33604 TaxID=933084 RepID=A0A067PEZ0_9AGAM|nr:hypothetical protein JAAARDRAFT_50303 [Jaapia argillacea MUCL 33604]